MKYKSLKIPEVILITGERHWDERGFLEESFQRKILENNPFQHDFVQDNLVFSTKNVFRGLHYQSNPFAQGKLVKCIIGEIHDFAVDLRRASEDFGRGVDVYLRSDRNMSLWIPPGFAHGYYVLSDFAYVSYKLTNEYRKELDRGINISDPYLEIFRGFGGEIKLSEKDKNLPMLKDVKQEDLF
jgi:dTDP-4-dehydrorhamnose 3,5-epimerase